MKSKNELKDYASALYSASSDKDNVERVKADLERLEELFNDVPSTVKFLSSPLVNKAKKECVLDDLKGELCLTTYAFVNVLIKRKALKYFSQIKREFEHIYNRKRGVIEGRIVSAFDLDKEQVKRLEGVFSEKLNGRVSFAVVVDKSLLAGVKIYIEDALYDYSYDTKMNKIRDNMLIEKE